MKRFAILAASVLMQVCFGGVYAWSTFVVPLRGKYGLTMTETQIIFGITFTVFTIVMVFAGRLMDRRGPRLVAAVGGLLLGLGYLICSLSGGSFPLLLLGYGITGGTAIGFGYVCPLATCVRWFPDRKGLVAGIVVAGYGGGAIVLSNVANTFLNRQMDVLEVFRIVGFTYGAVVVACAMMLSVPPKSSSQKAAKPAPVLGLLKQRSFQILAWGMFTGTFSAMMVAGNIKPIGITAGVGAGAATLAISTFAIGNAAGRITWGWVADRIGGKAIPISLLYISLVVAALIPAGASGPSFALASALAAFGLGGCMVIYAAEVAAAYGTEAVATVYPVVMVFYGFASLAGPAVGGRLFDLTSGYTASILTASGVTAIGLIGAVFLQHRERRESNIDNCRFIG